jgi:hypothetical protein
MTEKTDDKKTTRGGKREGAGSKLSDPDEGPRVNLIARVRSKNREKLECVRKLTGKSLGQLLDDLIEMMPDPPTDSAKTAEHTFRQMPIGQEW